MSNSIPSFEVNGETYEIKRTRYLMAEFDNMRDDISLTDEEQAEYVKEQDRSEALNRLEERKKELYEKYLETFDEDTNALYKKACEAYDNLVDEISKMDNVSGKQNKKVLDASEKLILKALTINDKGETIRTEKEAADIWCSYVDNVGKIEAMQFIAYAANYIIGNDEESKNPFVAQAKAKAERNAQMRRNGMKLAK